MRLMRTTASVLLAAVLAAACGPESEDGGGDLRLSFARSALDGPCPETAVAPLPAPTLDRLRLTAWRPDGKVHARTELGLGAGGAAEWKLPPGRDLRLQAVGVAGGAMRYLADAAAIDIDASRPAQVDLFFSPISNVGCAARPLSVARVFAAAGALGDGRVVIAGGADRVFAVPGCAACLDLIASDAADVFETGTGAAYPTARLNEPRLLASATPLANGDLLVVGGARRLRFAPGSWPFRVEPADRVSSFEVYRASEGRWIEKPLPSGRVFHSATLLADGRVLIAGGEGEPAAATSETLIYDPAIESAGDVRALAHPLHAARLGHHAVPISANRVLFVGGASGAGPQAEIFDPARSGDPFVDLNLTGAGANLFFFAAAPIPGRTDEFLLLGGSLADGAGGLLAPSAQNARILSVSRAEAKAGPALPAGCWLPSLLALADGRLIAAGGFSGPDGAPLGEIWVFDPAGDSLQALRDGDQPVALGSARAGSAALSVLGRAMLFGGLGESGPLASGEIIAGRPADER